MECVIIIFAAKLLGILYMRLDKGVIKWLNPFKNKVGSLNDVWNKNTIHSDLLLAKQKIYDQCGFACSLVEPEAESSEYGAAAFEINGFKARFRAAKITPKKVGQFVVLWKRDAGKKTQPYDASDPVDFFIISARNKNNSGQFVFSKSILVEKNIFSLNGRGGKRGIRVYPPWVQAPNSQAKKTQVWQLKYFLEMSDHKPLDDTKAIQLYMGNKLYR